MVPEVRSLEPVAQSGSRMVPLAIVHGSGSWRHLGIHPWGERICKGVVLCVGQ